MIRLIRKDPCFIKCLPRGYSSEQNRQKFPLSWRLSGRKQQGAMSKAQDRSDGDKGHRKRAGAGIAS